MFTSNGPIVFTFGAAIMRSDALRRAAAARVHASVVSGQPTLVVCSPDAAPAGGEIVWTHAFAQALGSLGIVAVALTRQQAQGDRAATLLTGLLERAVVPVITGALPYGAGHKPGRRENDIVAMRLGAALEASRVLIYTTGEGVLSADPKRVDGAVAVSHVNYMELLELAERGASVVHPVAAEIARTNGTRFEIRNLTSDRGTIVREDAHVDAQRPVSAITVSGGAALVTVALPSSARGTPAATELLRLLAERDIAIEMLTFVPGGVRLVCERSRVTAVLEEVRRLKLRVHVHDDATRLCVVGAGIRSTSGIIYRMLHALELHEIEALHFADSNVTITVLVRQSDAREAERILHDEFALAPSAHAAAALQFDAATGFVRVRGRSIRLGERQQRVLSFFLERPGKVIDVETAALATFGGSSKEEIAAFRVHLHNLRKKIEEDPEHPRFVITVPGKGYLFAR